jgi:hypothetical protein
VGPAGQAATRPFLLKFAEGTLKLVVIIEFILTNFSRSGIIEFILTNFSRSTNLQYSRLSNKVSKGYAQ